MWASIVSQTGNGNFADRIVRMYKMSAFDWKKILENFQKNWQWPRFLIDREKKLTGREKKLMVEETDGKWPGSTKKQNFDNAAWPRKIFP